VLVGRQRELATLSELVAERRSVALIGTAGVGKTALLRAAAEVSGREVFEGGALASLGWMSYVPLTRALGREPPQGDHAAVAGFVRERVDGGLLLLDDLHWSDSDTLAVLPLLRGRVTVVAAVRSGDEGMDGACEALRAAGSELIALDELEPEDAAMLVRTERPELQDDALAEILRAGGGSPFFLKELASSPEPSPTLRLALRARLDRCSADARRSMSLLALLGRSGTRELVGSAVDELVETGLVTLSEDGVEPRHALLAEAALDGLAEPARRELHAQLAQVLRDDGESARHHAAAGEPEEALRKALRAAGRSARPGERAGHLGLAASCAKGREANELRLEAADALLDTGRFEEAAALAAVVESGDPEVRARAALLRGRGLFGQGAREDAARALDAGIALVRGGNTPLEARLMLEKVRDDLAFGGSGVLENVRAAWDVAQAAGAELARADMSLGTAVCWYAHSDECLSVLERAVAGADPAKDPDLWFAAMEAFCGGLQMFGGTDRLDSLAAAAVERARALGLRRWELHFTWIRGQNAYLQGAYAEAIKWLRSCLADPAIAQPVRDQVAADLATALADTGHTDEALDVIEQAQTAIGTPWGTLVLFFAESEAAWLAGQPRRALAAAERAFTGEILEALRPQLYAARDWARHDLQREAGPPAGVEPLPFHRGYVLDSEALTALASSFAAAERLFLEAAEAFGGNVLRNELRSGWAASDAAVLDGAVGRGRRSLLELEDRAEAAGLTPLLARVRRSLRKTGVRRSAPRPRKGPTLTPRERQVMELVADGLTSAEIALKLGLARSTVESVVRSAMLKLGAKTRLQAATMAGER
jgi:DNA-binding CsgD family transcriptional regulator